MRIVHIITRLIVGGAQENTLLSCEGQRRLGHEVTLITGSSTGPEGSLMQRAEAVGYRVEVCESLVRAIDPVRDVRGYFALAQRLGVIKPDIVHTHSSKAGIIGRWAAQRARCRGIVHTIHGLAFTASTSRAANCAYRLLERQTAPITDAIVCVADDMARQSLRAHIGRPEQYHTVYSGMETAPFLQPPTPRQEVRRSLGLAEGDIAVGTIARLFDLKGHEDLIAMAPGLCARHPGLRFVWVGDGALRAKHEAAIARAGLQSRFILTGLAPPSRIPELAGAFDIMAHPSRREGLARAIAQGALAQKPVVAYDIDGNREGIIEGESGWAIKAFDLQAMSQALDRLAGDAALRIRMGTAGRRFALARFGAEVMVQGLERVYAQLAIARQRD